MVKKRKAFWPGYWTGATVASAIVSLRQDYLGLEGYIASLQADWIDAQYTVPGALALLALAVVIAVVYRND